METRFIFVISKHKRGGTLKSGKYQSVIVVFWPAAFLVGGDGQVAAQLAQLKGQMSAVEQASIQKKCGIQFQRQVPAS
jgi:hypothetical protein